MFVGRSVRAALSCAAVSLAAVACLPTPHAAAATRDEVARPATAAVASTPELLDRAIAAGELAPDTAARYLAYALGDPSRLPEAYRSEAPWRGTLPLLELEDRLARPGASGRAAADAIWGEAASGAEQRIRPGAATCSTSTSRLRQVEKTPHFFIQYNASKLAGLTIDDYAGVLEEAWSSEIDAFGWAAPPSRRSAPGGRYHVRIDTLATGLYGYVSTQGTYAGVVGDNPLTPWREDDAAASCMVLNRNYGEASFPSRPLASLQSTAAHELHHAVQFGYGALNGRNRPDAVFVEGSATWMEDEVFDGADDNQWYLWPKLAQSMGGYEAPPYPYWVVFRGMLEVQGHGPGGAEQVMQDFWELLSREQAKNLGAFKRALASHGIDLASAYHELAIAAKLSRPCSGGYVAPRCFEEGAEYVARRGVPHAHASIGRVGDRATGAIPDNYALEWVTLPTDDRAFSITVKNTSNGGALRASVVCDLGPADGLRVDDIGPGPLAGGMAETAGVDPAGCSSLVAVLTNVHQSAANPSRSIERSYSLTTS